MCLRAQGGTIIQNYSKILQNSRTFVSSQNSLHIDFSLGVYDRIFYHDRTTRVKPKYHNKLLERASSNHSCNGKIKIELGKIQILPAKNYYLISKNKKNSQLGRPNSRIFKGVVRSGGRFRLNHVIPLVVRHPPLSGSHDLHSPLWNGQLHYVH